VGGFAGSDTSGAGKGGTAGVGGTGAGGGGTAGTGVGGGGTAGTGVGGGGTAGTGAGSMGAGGKGVEGDPNNCGAPGHSCLGAACVDAMCVPEPVFDGFGGRVTLAADEKALYAINPEGVVSSLTFEAPRQHKVLGQACAEGRLVVEGDRVFVGCVGTQVKAFPKEGGPVESFGQPLVVTLSFDVDRGVIYSTSWGSIHAEPLDGSAGWTLTEPVGSPFEMAAWGDHLYVADNEFYSNGYVSSLPLDGSETPFYGFPFPGRFLSTSGDVLFGAGAGVAYNNYCGEGAKNTVWVSEAPGTEARVLHSTESQIGRIVSDEQHVYWPERCDGSIRRVSREGGAPLRLATFGFTFGDTEAPIAIAGPYLYYSDADGVVYRVAR
jgi:hypothetical protein